MKDKSVVAVLDSSALVAIIRGEPINVNSDELLAQAIITTYNLAEVANKMIMNNKISSLEIWQLLESLIPNTYTIDIQLSALATSFSATIDASYGLSLGDKYCLALGKLLDKPIYTANRTWQQFESLLGVTINLIR